MWRLPTRWGRGGFSQHNIGVCSDLSSEVCMNDGRSTGMLIAIPSGTKLVVGLASESFRKIGACLLRTSGAF